MNKELIKFIELCLADGEISDKEREVIYRKAEEFGIPIDECEIILEGLVLKNAEVNNKPFKTLAQRRIEISNKSYTKEEFAKIGAGLSSAYEKELEKQAEKEKEKEKESKKTGVFGFNSLDSKLLFWGIVGIVGALFFMGGEKITETPSDEPFALWQLLLGIVFVGWVLAKWIDE
tara:strand:+ start:35 stop:559 length:525 start_codon:yes stop_codon:yes gene_type:complete